MSALGIDFGTTNCVVSRWDQGASTALSLGRGQLEAEWYLPEFERLVPSVFGIDSAGGRRFGWEAKLRSPRQIQAVKRLLAGNEALQLGGRDYSARHVSALIFKYLQARALEQDVELDEAVVTIPANSTGKARFRTREAAGLAGIHVQTLINEPTAAAMAFVARMPEVETILVFDFGGGTIDVTVLDFKDGVFEERASRGIAGLGGREFDARLDLLAQEGMDGIRGLLDDQRLEYALSIELAKIRLSSTDEAVPILSPDRRQGVEVTRELYESRIEDLVTRALEPVEACLADVGMKGPDFDAVLMVGGTSLVPLVRQRLQERLAREAAPSLLCEPLTAVAQGASLAAASLKGEVDTVFNVMSNYALGTRSRDWDTKEYQFSTIIPRGVPLPYEASKSYVPLKDNAKSLKVQVWEGDEDRPFGSDAYVQLGEFDLVLDPPRPADQVSFDLTYAYDSSGILNVSAKDSGTGKVLFVDKVDFFQDGADIDPEAEDVGEMFAEQSATRPAAPTPEPAAPRQQQSPVRAEAAPTRVSLVVDGSNLACEGRQIATGKEKPSFAQLLSGLEHLQRTFPDADVLVVVDANFKHRVADGERAEVDAAISARRIIVPPAGTNGKGDAIVARLGQLTGGLIVTNDSYKELQDEHPWLFEGRVIGALPVNGMWLFEPRTPVRAQPRPAPRPGPGAKPVAFVPPQPKPTAPARDIFEGLPTGWQNSHWWSGE